jgi:hypothetical protein
VADQKTPNGNLAAQIEFARRNIESWPSWLRDNLNFSPSEPASTERRDNSAEPSVQKNRQDDLSAE